VAVIYKKKQKLELTDDAGRQLKNKNKKTFTKQKFMMMMT